MSPRVEAAQEEHAFPTAGLTDISHAVVTTRSLDWWSLVAGLMALWS